MRYLTKEWFDIVRRAAIINWLEPDPLTATVNEEHYRERYQEKLREHLSSYEPYDPELSKAIDEITYEQIKRRLGEEDANLFRTVFMTEKNYEMEESVEEVKLEQAEQDFVNWQKSLVAICETLPSEIKEKIADIRMIALGRATQEVIDILKVYCEKQRAIADKISDEVKYRNAIEEAKTSVGQEILRQNEELDESARTNFAEQLLNEFFKGVSWEGNNLRIDFTEFGIVITDAEIIEKEEPIIDAAWFEHEVYCENGKMELHMLAVGSKEGVELPLYFTVRGSDIQFADD